MWFAIVAVSLLLMVAHAVYFSGRIRRAIAALFPRAERWLRGARAAYLVVASSIPVLLVGYVAYALIARPERIGEPDSPLYDYLILFPFWLVTLASFQSTLLILPLDAVHWLLRRAGVALAPAWTRRRHAVALAVVGVFAVYVPARVAIDGRALEIRVHELALEDLPPALDGLEVALVADIQADRYTDDERIAQLVAAVNRHAPDLIVIAGDMITRAPRFIEPAAAHAGRLRARHGVFACIGDHENFAYRDRERSVRAVRDALARHGVPMLDNEVRTVAIDGAEVAVVLATHNYIRAIDDATIRGLLAQASGADLQIVCAHQTSPELLALSRAAGVDLFLSGHTHGGQVRFWLPFADLTPARLETRYIEGAHRLGGMHLIVTAGLGTSVTPFRYRSPASVDIVRLRRASP